MRDSNVLMGLRSKVWIFPTLALITVVIGQLCANACAFIRGDILGLDLNIFGILFYSLLLVIAVLYRKVYPKEWLMKALAAIASIGMGAELILIKFQVQNGVYCPKCLISGFFFVVMFFVVAPHLKKWVVILLVFLGVFFASFTFSGSVIPSYAEEAGAPNFGNDKGQIEIIVYSDYFCPACRQVDEQIHTALRKLKDKVRIRFVDVPLHAGSLEYAEVFLYTWFESGNNLEAAIKVREILFDEAKTKAEQSGAMNALKKKGILFKVDREHAREIFRGFYNPLMTMDKINATPTLVIVRGNERKSHVGGKDISKALEEVLSSQDLQRK
jgi:thiol:disulfide interchange protein DsbA